GDSETNLSIDPILIEESDTEAYTVHAEIMNSDIGVLYAINYLEYPEDAELFFGDDTKIITGDVKINNPIVLEELGLNPENEINMKGEYEVFQSDTYKYIIID